jgi:hypothetical protein
MTVDLSPKLVLAIDDAFEDSISHIRVTAGITNDRERTAEAERQADDAMYAFRQAVRDALGDHRSLWADIIQRLEEANDGA